MTTLHDARTALERGDWSGALEVLDALDGAGDAADRSMALELKAQAAYGAGQFEDAVAAWEQLVAHERGRGDVVAAARAAAMTAMYLMMDTGLMAPVRGWLRTAEQLLSGHDRTPAHALIAMTRTYERFMCGDMDAAREQSALAIELGTETGVDPAVVIGRVAAARVRIFDGDLQGGLAQLDEVGALLMSGGADPLTTGMMYCELVCAAQGLALYDMAAEWTAVMDRWRPGAAVGGISGRCRVHRAELLRVSGPCDAAEAEALGACDELRPWMRREFGWPLHELGMIRLRRGDLAGAEEALVEAHRHAWSPQPGLALLRLEQGDVATAAAMVADAIEHPFDIPSKERPPFGDLRLAPLLDAQAEIAAVQGDATTARTAATRLARLAERYPGPFLQSWALLAAARAALSEDDVAAAIDAAGVAVRTWTDLGAPYEAASARLVLAEAYERAGSTASARMEREAAEQGFRAFGAMRRAASTAALLRDAEPSPDAPRVGAPMEATFSVDGSARTIAFQGRTTTMRDLKGLRYVARLVAEPGREFHVLDLVASESGVLRPGVAHPDLGPASHGGESGIPVLDDAARDAYRRRLAEIDDDIDDARRMNDPERAALAERDREYLIAELTSAVGLGGRGREVGASAERARTSVARSIRYALDQLAEVQPDLARHLDRSIRTGTYCSYENDPVTPLAWHL
jgi:tetratricopeptide (TPR) repeat protein